MSQHRRLQRRAFAAAALLMPLAATTVPGFAEDTVARQAPQLGNVERSRTYTYEKQVFICGEAPEKDGNRRRLIGEPYEPRISMLEPNKDDPMWKTWDIVFKIVCKNFYQQPNIDTALGKQPPVR